MFYSGCLQNISVKWLLILVFLIIDLKITFLCFFEHSFIFRCFFIFFELIFLDIFCVFFLTKKYLPAYHWTVSIRLRVNPRNEVWPKFANIWVQRFIFFTISNVNSIKWISIMFMLKFKPRCCLKIVNQNYFLFYELHFGERVVDCKRIPHTQKKR